MTEEQSTELDPMTDMRIKIEQLEKANAAITEKFEKQSQMLAQALDSNMKLFAMVNAPTERPAESPKPTAQPDEAAGDKAYEEIVGYFR